jgi:AcrR family transcriptional regulator
VARPKTPLLSRRGIAEKALELTDREGLEGLTMRRLARELGVEGASLYHHVASRDDLLDEITSVIDEQIDLEPLDGGGGWIDQLTHFARSYRRAFAQHPNVAAAIMRRPVRTRAALAAYDRIFEVLLDAGFDGGQAGAIVAAVDYIVLGSAIETFTAGFDRPVDEYAAEYPNLSRALAEADRSSLDDQGFELALGSLLAALRSSDALERS